MGIESAKNNQKTFVKSQYYEIKRLLKEVVKAVLNGRFAILKKILGQSICTFWERRDTGTGIFLWILRIFLKNTASASSLSKFYFWSSFFFLFQFSLVLIFTVSAWVYVCVQERARESTFKVNLYCIIYMTVML